MARIVGVDIPRNKKVPYSLSYIHGIGLTTAKLLCQEAKVDINAREVNKSPALSFFNIRIFLSIYQQYSPNF